MTQSRTALDVINHMYSPGHRSAWIQITEQNCLIKENHLSLWNIVHEGDYDGDVICLVENDSSITKKKRNREYNQKSAVDTLANTRHVEEAVTAIHGTSIFKEEERTLFGSSLKSQDLSGDHCHSIYSCHDCVQQYCTCERTVLGTGSFVRVVCQVSVIVHIRRCFARLGQNLPDLWSPQPVPRSPPCG